MRKLLLYLLFIVAMPTLARQEKTVEFDFTNPASLTPSMSNPIDAPISLSGMTFTEGEISITFTRSGGPDYRNAYLASDNRGSFLKISRGAIMTIKGIDGVVLTKMTMPQTSDSGELDPSVGEISMDTWVADLSEEVQLVDFIQKAQTSPRIEKLIITYLAPIPNLVPVSSTIQNGSLLTKFDNMVLTFGSDVNFKSSTGIELKHEDGTTYSLNLNVDGNKVTLSASSSITVSGNYTLTVPVGIVGDGNDAVNRALTYTFTISDNIVSLKPTTKFSEEEGSPTLVPTFSQIQLTFDSQLKKLKDACSFTNGETNIPLDISLNGNVATLKSSAEIGEPGNYIITIPASSFENVAGFQNQELIYYFTIIDKKTLIPTASIAENAELAKFQQMRLIFENNIHATSPAAIIYMAKEGGASHPLDVSISNNVVTLSLSSSIRDAGTYIIDIPEGFFEDGDGWQSKALTYKFSIASDKLQLAAPTPNIANGSKISSFQQLCLTFEKEVSIKGNAGIELIAENGTQTALDAAISGKVVTLSVKGDAITADGTYTVKVPAGLIEDKEEGWQNKELTYMFTVAFVQSTLNYTSVTPAPGTYEKLSKEGIKILFNENLADMSNLTLRLKKEGTDKVAAAYLKKNGPNEVIITFNNDIIDEGTYHITVDEGSIWDEGKGLPEATCNPEFTLTYTIKNSGTVDPDPTETLACSLLSSTVSLGTQKLTLEFSEGTNITVKGSATIKDSDGNVTTGAITALSNVPNQFDINIAHLSSAGSYTLEIPEGIFKATNASGVEVSVSAISKSFIIASDDELYGDYNYSVAVYNEPGDRGVLATFFNDFIIYDYAPVGYNPNKVVKIFPNANISDIKATGHFEEITNLPDMNGFPIYGVRLVLDVPFEEHSLKNGSYAIEIPSGTVGNSKFYEYMNQKNPDLKESDCSVNETRRLFYLIDNTATGINTVEVDENVNQNIYNLQGTRVKSMDVPGIYIVNGKKVVKK